MAMEAFSELVSEVLAVRVLLIKKGIISKEELKEEIRRIDEGVKKNK